MGFSSHPSDQHSFEDRLSRAQSFAKDSQLSNIYVDGFDNAYEQTFQSWPDKFYRIDKNMMIVEKSEYSDDAKLTNDYSIIQ